MRLAVLVLVVSTILSGCFGFGGPCPSGSATWEEPGLYAALPGVSGREKVEYREIMPPARLPFDDSEAARRWPGYALRSVSWEWPRLPRERADPHMTVHVPDDNTAPIFSLTASTSMSEEGLRGLFDQFVTNATSADLGRMDQWFEDLLRTRKDAVIQNRGGEPHVLAYTYTVTMPGPFRLKPFFDALGGFENGSAASGGPNSGSVRFPGWSFAFRLPVRELRIEPNEEVFFLEVGPNEWTSASVTSGIAADEPAMKLWINQTFTGLGLMEPMFHNWRYTPVRC